MEFSLEDLFAEPPPKISGRLKKEEGQGPSKSGSGSNYSPLKANNKEGTVKTRVAEGHVMPPTKTLSQFQPQQEQRRNLDSGSLNDLFIEPPKKASPKITGLSSNHSGNFNKEGKNVPLVELQEGKMAPHNDDKIVQSKAEVANASKGTPQVPTGNKFENGPKLDIGESKIKQNDNKEKNNAPLPNINSSSSSLSSEKKYLNSSKINECVGERAQEKNEDKRNSEENIQNKVKQTPSYHIPSLEEILGKSPMTASITKRSPFSMDEEPTFLKKPRKGTVSHLQHGNVICDLNKNDSLSAKLNKNYSTERPTINEEFKKHFLEKKKPVGIQKVTVTEYDGHTERESTISKQEIEGDTKSNNITKKKAGNYLRKLHTKCRVSRKEIQMLGTKTIDGEADFFGEAVDRPEIAKSQQNSEITEYPYISFKKDIFAEGQIIVKSAAQNRKEKKNKKRKANKKRKKQKGGNGDANSQNNDNDDIILLPRKDTKPHKWPVRKISVEQQSLQPEENLPLKIVTSPNDKNLSQKESSNESIKNRLNDIVFKKKLENASAPSLLDEIISQSATLYPSCPRQNAQGTKNETALKVDKRTNWNEKPLLTEQSPGFSKIKLAESVKATKDLNKLEMNEWWKEDNLEENKMVLNKQDITGNTQKDDTQNSLVADSCKQSSVSHDIFDAAAKVGTEGIRQEVVCDKKMDSCVEESSTKRDNTSDNRNDIPMKEILNRELEGTSSLSNAIENARRVASKTNSMNVKEESLLSLVSDVPIDLTVAEKEEGDTKSKGRSKRGGKKRKRRANKGVPGNNKGQHIKKPKMEIDTKPKVKCKYFLDGKCRMGADCGFLHEGVPARRELCRYYVTDCCLAQNCIFMHSEFPCKFYHAYSKCNNGDNCKYSHKELTDETRQLLNELLTRDETRKQDIEKPENSQGTGGNTAESSKKAVEEEPVANVPKLFESLI